MRLVVIAVGRLKHGPERELAERYRGRFEDIGRKLGFRGLIFSDDLTMEAASVVGDIVERGHAALAAGCSSEGSPPPTGW